MRDPLRRACTGSASAGFAPLSRLLLALAKRLVHAALTAKAQVGTLG
jgi:hypothetical protein